jgi:hypothetical protein
MLDIFHTLAEVAVAITGFSSLIIIFRGSTAWSRQDYVSFSFVLCWSIGSIFLSLLPIVLVEFGVVLATASQVGLFSAIVYMCAVGVLLTRVQTRVLKEGGGSVNTRSKLLMGLSFGSIVLIAFTAGIGVLPGPQHAWFAATIVFLMAHATADLGVFVVQTTRRNQPG